MKVLIAGVLASALLAFAPSASAQDISGAWDVTLTTPQGEQSVEANIKQAGEAITGQLISPLGTVDLTGTLIKDALEVGFSVPVQGNVFEIKMKGKVEGDIITGNADFAGLGEAPWSAKRKPAVVATDGPAPDPAPAAPAAAAGGGAGGDAAGKWDMILSIAQVGDIPMTGSFTQTGDRVTGTLSGPQGDIAVTGSMIGTTLTIEFTAPTPNGAIPVTMSGDLGANGFTGKASLGGLGEADWSAKRATP
jgi:hypothetical protein